MLSYYAFLRSEFRVVMSVTISGKKSCSYEGSCLIYVICVCLRPEHIVLCFCFVFLRLVYPMMPVSLDCPFLNPPLVFSNVYLIVYSLTIARYDS